MARVKQGLAKRSIFLLRIGLLVTDMLVRVLLVRERMPRMHGGKTRKTHITLSPPSTPKPKHRELTTPKPIWV